TGVRRSAAEHRLPVEELSAVQVRDRFPWFTPADDEVGLFEPRAGVLFPEAAIRTALALAERAGAELHYDEPVVEWEAGSSLTVRTGSRTCTVERLVLSAGAWMAGGLPKTRLPLTITRQALFWFEPSPNPVKGFAEMPVFIWEWEPDRMLYGFPDLGHGVKVAIHREGESADPDNPRRPADPREAEALRGVLASRLPGLGAVRETAVCLYTNTPSGDFLLDRHPDDPRVMLASPCSGHGFKFAPAIGEVLADLVEDQVPRFDLTPFRL
ncbi:MAG: N-methyl-L-tryptophan oxidase, partial [Gemmatimonadales bacterium]